MKRYTTIYFGNWFLTCLWEDVPKYLFMLEESFSNTNRELFNEIKYNSKLVHDLDVGKRFLD
jgi:hypothetical protein